MTGDRARDIGRFEDVADTLGVDAFNLCGGVVADDIDYEDEVRLAVEERASLSPDALTGMEDRT